MLASDAPLAASPDVILTELEDGTGVLLHLRTKFYYVLNGTGVFAWKALQSGRARTHDALASALTGEFEVALEQARADLAALLEVLVDEGLVEG